MMLYTHNNALVRMQTIKGSDTVLKIKPNNPIISYNVAPKNKRRNLSLKQPVDNSHQIPCPILILHKRS